jgi:glycosyltransferase involved in cell wall biosynthesis
MRILVINYEFPPLGGGAGNASYHIARGIARLGHEVAVLTSGFRGLPKREMLDGFEVYRIPVMRRHQDHCSPLEMVTFILSGCFHAPRIAQELQPDVALAFMTIPSGPVALWLKKTKRLPYLVLLRGGDVPGFLPEQLATYHKLTRPLIHKIWRESLKPVANSEGLKNLAQHSAPRVEMSVIPNGIDAEKYRPSLNSAEPHRVRLLFVGRLSVQKDLATLVTALSLVAQRTPDVELRIVGDGPERERLQQKVNELRLTSRVTFCGWVGKNQIVECYQHADVFVLPSLYEGMPNVVLEAMACGLPIVATNIAGSNELVEDGVNGFLVPVRDSAALAEGLHALAQDASLRRGMGLASRQAALSRDWTSVACQYLSLAERMLGGTTDGTQDATSQGVLR